MCMCACTGCCYKDFTFPSMVEFLAWKEKEEEICNTCYVKTQQTYVSSVLSYGEDDSTDYIHTILQRATIT